MATGGNGYGTGRRLPSFGLISNNRNGRHCRGTVVSFTNAGDGCRFAWANTGKTAMVAAPPSAPATPMRLNCGRVLGVSRGHKPGSSRPAFRQKPRPACRRPADQNQPGLPSTFPNLAGRGDGVPARASRLAAPRQITVSTLVPAAARVMRRRPESCRKSVQEGLWQADARALMVRFHERCRQRCWPVKARHQQAPGTMPRLRDELESFCRP